MSGRDGVSSREHPFIMDAEDVGWDSRKNNKPGAAPPPLPLLPPRTRPRLLADHLEVVLGNPTASRDVVLSVSSFGPTSGTPSVPSSWSDTEPEVVFETASEKAAAAALEYDCCRAMTVEAMSRHCVKTGVIIRSEAAREASNKRARDQRAMARALRAPL